MIYKNVNGTQKLVTNIRKPKKWRRFEWIQTADDKQYIDTGIMLSSKFRYDIKFELLSVTNAIRICGYRNTSTSTTGTYFMLNYPSASTSNIVVFNKSLKDSTSFAQIGNYNVSVSDTFIKVNDELKTSYTIDFIQPTRNFFIFGYNNYGSVYEAGAKYVKVLEFKLWNEENLIRHMIPCQYNGQYGMWDLVEDKFYGNKGTGAFTVGPEIPNYDEVEKILIPGNSEYPRGLELCDYLQGDGAAYINSGYSLNRNCSIDITLQLTEKVNQARFVGLQKSGCYLLMYSGDSGNNIKTYTKIASGGTYSTFIAHNTKINTYYINNSSHKSLVNETSKVTHTDIPATDDYYGNCYLFWANGAAAGTQTTARIYSCRIYDNEVLVRDFIPCIYNNEPGMWDKVNRIFYGNSGSGNFIALSNTNYQEQLQDSVPSNVTLHEYIQGDGTNYIDTGIVLTKDSTIEFTAQLLDKTNQLRLIGVTDTNLRFFVYIGDSGANIKTYTNFNATNTYATLSVFNKAKHKYVLNEYNTHKCYLDGELVHTYTGIPDNDTNTKTCYIFWANGDGGNPKSACRIYECKIYTNNILVGHFVPCKYNGLAGLWDIVTQTFYGNSSANFSLGPEMTLQKEIPIWVLKNALIGDHTAYIETNFIPTKNTEIKLKFDELANTINTYYPIICASGDGIELFTKANVNYAAYNGTSEKLFTGPNSSVGPIEVTLRHNYFEANGVVYINTSVNENLNPTRSLPIFGFKNSSNAMDSRKGAHRLYYLKIYNDGILVRDLVPATMGGRPGLYDKVNHKMYFNANSSGNFTVE